MNHQPVRELPRACDGLHYVDINLQDVEFANATVVKTPISHRLSHSLPTIL